MSSQRDSLPDAERLHSDEGGTCAFRGCGLSMGGIGRLPNATYPISKASYVFALHVWLCAGGPCWWASFLLSSQLSVSSSYVLCFECVAVCVSGETVAEGNANPQSSQHLRNSAGEIHQSKQAPHCCLREGPRTSALHISVLELV